MIEAGLPNIEGDTGYTGSANQSYTSGAFSKGSADEGYNPYSSGSSYGKIKFSAQDSNPIYGNSTTVQPTSICMYLEFYIN